MKTLKQILVVMMIVLVTVSSFEAEAPARFKEVLHGLGGR